MENSQIFGSILNCMKMKNDIKICGLPLMQYLKGNLQQWTPILEGKKGFKSVICFNFKQVGKKKEREKATVERKNDIIKIKVEIDEIKNKSNRKQWNRKLILLRMSVSC